MSMMVSFVLSFFPRDVLDEILKLIESVSEDFPSYSFKPFNQEYSDSFVLAARFFYLFIVNAGTMLRFQVPVFSKFIII